MRLSNYALALLMVSVSQAASWPDYGGTPDQSRYSSLRQINRSNVKQLQVAWSYDTGEQGGTAWFKSAAGITTCLRDAFLTRTER